MRQSRRLDARDRTRCRGIPVTSVPRTLVDLAAAVQEALDKHCLVGVRVGNKEPRVEVVSGTAKPELAEQGWRVFLVKVLNPDGVRDIELRATSPNGPLA